MRSFFFVQYSAPETPETCETPETRETPETSIMTGALWSTETLKIAVRFR